MNLELKYYGRLGNNLIQLRNALHIALHYKYNIILPPHSFFTYTYIVFNNKINRQNERWMDEFYFYHKDRIKNVNPSIFEKHGKKINSIIKDIFTIKNVGALGKNELVIHIRSGDIFRGNGAHADYVMPPLSYYKNIIDGGNYDKIYLITEDTTNPCSTALLKMYPNIMFQQQSLEEDVKMILSAKSVVMSYGTFIPQLLELSDNIQKVYCPSYCNYKHTNCETRVIDLETYYKEMWPWKNTFSQKIKMLIYS